MTEHTPDPEDLDEEPDDLDEDNLVAENDPLVAEPPHPINWNLLTADDAEVGERAVFLAVLAFLPEPHLHVRGAVLGHQLSRLFGDEPSYRGPRVDRHAVLLPVSGRVNGARLHQAGAPPCPGRSGVGGATQQ